MKENGSLKKFYQYAFPMPTILVTCIDEKTNPNSITVAWHTPVSKKPPLHGISIAPQRHSYNLIKNQKQFTINFLNFSQANTAHFCGTHSGRSVAKHTQTPITYIPSKTLETPIIKEAYAHLECSLYDTIVTGDHSIFLGEVHHVSYDKNAFANDLLNIENITPLYYRGANSYTRIDPTTKTMF